MPVYSVEKAGFPQILTQFDSCYKLLSRKYFSQVALPVLYAKLCNNVESELQGIKCYSATTDLWSSKGLLPYSYELYYSLLEGTYLKEAALTHVNCWLSNKMEVYGENDFKAP